MKRQNHKIQIDPTEMVATWFLGMKGPQKGRPYPEDQAMREEIKQT